MQEGISYMAACEIPGLIVSVQRGGPGLGTIQPSQSDYFQAVYGGGNGDYRVVVLAPASVQEMADMVGLAKELMFRWRMPVMILSDGAIGQMMERCVLPPFTPRRTDTEIREQAPWAVNGLGLRQRSHNFMTSLELDPALMEDRNRKMQQKYREIEASEVRFEEYLTFDAETVIVAYGLAARVAMGAIDQLRAEGMKVGLMRPLTLWPFPEKRLRELARQCQRMLVVEMNEGQMVRDVKLAVEGACPVGFYGRSGGMIASPDEIVNVVKGLK